MSPLREEVAGSRFFLANQKKKPLTEDSEGKNHVLHDFVAQAAADVVRCVHSGRFQVALVHPDLHLFLHLVDTVKTDRENVSFKVSNALFNREGN